MDNTNYNSTIDNGQTMNIKSNGGKKSPILIIILIIIILGLGGYVGYDKFIAKNNCTKCNVETKTNTKTEMTAKEKFDLYVSNIGERKYALSESFIMSNGISTKTYILGNDNKLYITNDGEEYIPGAETKGGKVPGTYTGISDVIAIYKVEHSNGTGSAENETLGLLIVKKDGSTSIIKNPTKNDEVTELEYKYIVGVHDTVYHTSVTELIDIDGNIYILK